MNNRERKLYEQRIDGFIKRLNNMYYESKIPIDAEYCKFGSGVPFEQRLNGNYKLIKVGDTWGNNLERAWFRLRGKVPEEWRGKCVAARVNLGGEALIFSNDGVPMQALSMATVVPDLDFIRDRLILFEQASGGEEFEFWIEATAGQLFGLKMHEDVGDQKPATYGSYEATVNNLSLAIFRKDIWQLYLDCFLLNDLMKAMPEDSVRRARILRSFNQVIDQFMGDQKSTSLARNRLKPELKKKQSPSDLSTTVVGHAHLDTAWLWTVEETIRKCARTFSTQIRLMEKYPDYVFGASQAQLYAFVKQHYPALYEKIKEKVADGRWEIQGGMWVEADSNLISGESMVRQILQGKNYFKDEFNLDVKNLWLPDVFGYSAAMPQILNKCGLHVMVTQKLSWNQFNRFPHHTFIWQGIDGTDIVVHFPPEDNYVSDLRPSALRFAQENFDEKAYLDEFLTLFGFGDGGCGPTEEMIETGLRQNDLEGSPKVVFGYAQEMLDRIMQKKEELPKWSGELYLEMHRGTLTTQAFMKKMNRFMELKLRELEILYSLLPLEQYPAEEFQSMWRRVLLNQFHDILPGSSITPVYENCRKDYENLTNQTEELSRQFGKRLLKEEPASICLINTLSYPYSRPIMLSESWAGYEIVDENNRPVAIQSENGVPVIRVEIPPLHIMTLMATEKKEIEDSQSPSNEFVLENEQIRYEFTEDGTIRNIYDKECVKSVLSKEEAGNVLSLYEDLPVNWDAWDIDVYYENQKLEQACLQSREWICNGPVRQGIQQHFTIGQSDITQRVYLSKDSKRLDFETEVVWRETHKMLRVSFPVNVRSDEATFEIQYGHIKRNTHRNTSWDLAKFEVAAHRFADFSDKDYGVALLNNCKYGHKVLENVIDLNLLRSTTVPDPEADQGGHQFTYSLLPHKGEMTDSNVISEALQLNQPPAIFYGFTGQGVTIPFSLDTENIVLETIKKAEKEEAIVLRLYEPNGRKAVGTLHLDVDPINVYETDLMENNNQKLTVKDGSLTLTFNPFEIKTLKVLSSEMSSGG